MSGFTSTIEVGSGGGGGGGSMEVIDAGSLSGASDASITISSIPQTYVGLKLMVSLKTDQATQGGTLGLRVNNLGASSGAYSSTYFEGYATSEVTTEVSGADEWRIWRGVQGTSANDIAITEVTFMRYAENANVHTCLWQAGAKRASGDWATTIGTGTVIVSNNIDQLVMTAYSGNNFTDGEWVLYGLKNS